MTIGIGVLCCTKPKNPKFIPGKDEDVRPDALVLVADTMGSTDYDSTDDLYKMFVYPEEKLYAVCAGHVEMCSEIIYAIKTGFASLSQPRTHGIILELLNNIVNGHRGQHFKMDVLTPNFLPVIGAKETPEWQHEKIEEAYRDYDTNAHLIVGTFDERGQAYMYFIGKRSDTHGLVHTCLFPGFHTIGVGARNATFWLRYRGQSMSLSPKQSAYHAYEAKRMAANAPTVNDRTEVLMVNGSGESFYFSDKLEASEKSPWSLPQLEAAYQKYGPQDTRSELGHPLPMQSTSRKSRQAK